MKSSHNPSANSRHILLEIGIICVLLLAIGVPRLLGLDRFATTDETLWLTRSGRFYYALAHHDFSATFQKSHPGVTVMWAGLVGYLRVYPQYDQDNHPATLFTLKQRGADIPLRLLVVGREALIVFNLLALAASFLFARQIFGTLPALSGFLVIAFDPFHIALSRVLHLDGTLANLLLLSLLAFLVYLESRDKKAFLVSAVAAGLAWLTKSPSIFLIPTVFLLTLSYWLRGNKNQDKITRWKSAFADLKTLVAWGLIAALIFFLLWPSMWVNPINSLLRILGDAMGYAQGGHDSAVFFNGTIHPNGEIPDPGFYLVSFLWRTTPVTLLGLFAIIVMLIRKDPASWLQAHNPIPADSVSGQNLLQDVNFNKWVITALLLFALAFTLLMNLGLKKFDRYILPSVVPLDFVAGLGLFWLANWIAQLLHERWRALVTGLILLGLVAGQALLAWKSFPYYFTYYNALLGGSRRAADVLQIGWGEGLDEAARYINQKPNADQLWVISWYGNGSFFYFSTCKVRTLEADHPWTAADWNEFNKSDYAVVYIHEWQRNLPAEVLDKLRGLKPEYSVWIDGLEYARVYKIR